MPQSVTQGFPGGAVAENLPANAGDTGSSPGLGGSHMPRSNYWAREPQPLSLRVWSCAPQWERPRQWEARAPRWRVAPARHNWRKPSHRNEDPTQPKIKKKKKKKKCDPKGTTLVTDARLSLVLSSANYPPSGPHNQCAWAEIKNHGDLHGRRLQGPLIKWTHFEPKLDPETSSIINQ